MNDKSDYYVYKMVNILNREVLILDPTSPTKFRSDETWKDSTREVYFFLFKFLQENALVNQSLVENFDDVDNVALKFSDLTHLGQVFIKAGIDDKWLSSFDRKNKNFSDVSLLKKGLEKIKASK